MNEQILLSQHESCDYYFFINVKTISKKSVGKFELARGPILLVDPRAYFVQGSVNRTIFKNLFKLYCY